MGAPLADVAVLCDIHGNLPALDAVPAELRDRPLSPASLVPDRSALR